jgi:hypothetical protein
MTRRDRNALRRAIFGGLIGALLGMLTPQAHAVPPAPKLEPDRKPDAKRKPGPNREPKRPATPAKPKPKPAPKPAASQPAAKPVPASQPAIAVIQGQLKQLRARLAALQAAFAPKTPASQPSQGQAPRSPIEKKTWRLEQLRPFLQAPINELTAWKKRWKGTKRKPPADLPERADVARRMLSLLQLEVELLRKQAQLIAAQKRAQKAAQLRARKKESDAHSLATKKARDRAAARQRTLLDRQKAIARAADKAAREARERERQAQAQVSRSLAEDVLRKERSRLATVSHKQAHVANELVSKRARLSDQRRELERQRFKIAQLLRAPTQKDSLVRDELFFRLDTAMRQLRPTARRDLWALIAHSDVIPGARGKISRETLALSADYEPQKAQLVERWKALDRRATVLKRSSERLRHERLIVLQEQLAWLAVRRIELFNRLSPRVSRQVRGLGVAAMRELISETDQLTFDATYWAFRRWRQLLALPSSSLDVVWITQLLRRALEVLLGLLLLLLLLRRWDLWLRSLTRQVGRSVTLGRNAIRLAKLLDVLRHAGPALLTLVTVELLYRRLGAADATIELRIVYQLAFWIALYRLQLRLVESIAKYAGMEDALRGAEGEELFEEDEDLEGPPVPRAVRLAQQTSAAGIESRNIVPASVLLVRSVRAATRYILAVVLVLQITELAVGRGSFYALTDNLSWWATIPFIYYFLRLWRPHIARAYLQLANANVEDTDKRRRRKRFESRLRPLVEQAQNRWYGVAVIAVAFVVVSSYRLMRFGRRYLTSLDWSKKLLAFVFRRQVERHAQQKGHVVTQRHLLPESLLAQFPGRPLLSRDRPQPIAETDAILELFNRWKEDQSDGSLAIIGRAGMGKTTLLNQLPELLGVPVLRGEIKTKITRPAKLWAWLAETFSIEKPNSEKELIRLIREEKHPVVAIDGAHNAFMRQVGGFEAWETLVRVVNATCDNVLWILAFDQVAWDYLHNVSGRVHYFRRALRLAPWSEDQLRRLVMSRMRRARYRVSFSDLVVTELEGTSASALLGRTSQGYFRMLWDASNGNPRLACHFWLDSLVADPETHQARVHLFTTPSTEKLETLNDDIAFVLTAVAEHGTLDADEAARTNLSADFCTFAFRYCLEGGLLERYSAGAHRYRIGTRWQQAVLRYLKRKHLLRD